jgi:hypothetical protein
MDGSRLGIFLKLERSIFQEELMEQMHLQDQYLEFVRAMWNAGWASDAQQVAVNQPEAKPENTLTFEATSGETLKTA